MPLFPGVGPIELLTQAMRVASLNHTLLANNIANVDTPKYNPIHLDFQATLRAELEGRGRVSLRRTRPEHLESERQMLKFENLALSSKNDYNKVDLEEEMVRLSENTSRYTLYGSLMVKNFQMYTDMLTNLR